MNEQELKLTHHFGKIFDLALSNVVEQTIDGEVSTLGILERGAEFLIDRLLHVIHLGALNTHHLRYATMFRIRFRSQVNEINPTYAQMDSSCFKVF